MKKAAFKYIEAELYDYHKTVKELEKRRFELMYAGSERDESGIRASGVSAPTEQLALKIVSDTRSQELERIARAVERVYNVCDDERKKLIRLKYWTKPQTKTWEGISQELNISRMTSFRWNKEIVVAIGDLLGWR